MAARKSIFKVETRSAPPLTVGDTTITPQSQAIVTRLPCGGFVWNRPVRVLVERAGQVERVPIIDATRMVQLGMGLLLTAMTIAAARRTNRKETKR